MSHAFQYATRKMTIFCACKSLFQFTTMKMIIFCARKNLLNNKKSLKGYQNRCVKKAVKKFWWKETLLKVDLENNWYHSCGCSDDSRNCEQMKKRITDKWFEKKVYFEPEPPSITGKVCYHYNSWVTGAYAACMFDRNSGGTSQTEWLFEPHLRSFGYFKCSTVLWLALNPSCKGNSLTRVDWVRQTQFVTWRPK